MGNRVAPVTAPVTWLSGPLWLLYRYHQYVGNDTPEDPVTLLQAGAASQHEMYLAWVSVGFTEAQALELLKAVVMAMVLK